LIPFYAGLSYKKLGKPNLALQFLERSAFLAVPAYVAEIYHHLGRAYSAKRMFAEALNAFEKVCEIDLKTTWFCMILRPHTKRLALIGK